jgi:predicted DNA binding CopG/RHH family protein
MVKRKKKPPKFKSETQERRFWLRNDSTAYVDYSVAKPAVFSNLKPTTRSISLRLPEALLAELKALANQRDIPYQSLMKLFLAEKVRKERG